MLIVTSGISINAQIAEPKVDRPTEVEQLRREVSQLKERVDRLTKMVDALTAQKPGDQAKSDPSLTPEKVRAAQATPSSAPQSTAVNDGPRIAIGTKAQGGDLSGAGNLLRTDRITIGGYGEVEYRDAPISERSDGGGTPTFVVPRFVMGIAAVLSEKQNIVFNSEIEYEFGSREIDVEQAFIEWKLRPELAFRGGIFVPAIGRFNTYHDSNLNLTNIRPLINQFIVPTAYRDAGVGIRGRFKLPRKMKLSYEADIVNGMHSQNADGEPTPFSRLLGQSSAAEPGAIAFQDPNRNKALIARIGYSPVRGLEFGISGYTGRVNKQTDDPVSANIVFFDASYHSGNLSINGEYGRSNIVGAGILRQSPTPPVVDPNDPASIRALAEFVAQHSPGQDGFYVEGSYQLHPKMFRGRFDEGAYLAPVFRYEVVRLDRTLKDFYLNRSRATFGMNFAPSASVIFKANYLLNHTFGPVPNVPGTVGGPVFGESPLPHLYYGRSGFTGGVTYIF